MCPLIYLILPVLFIGTNIISSLTCKFLLTIKLNDDINELI